MGWTWTRRFTNLPPRIPLESNHEGSSFFGVVWRGLLLHGEEHIYCGAIGKLSNRAKILARSIGR